MGRVHHPIKIFSNHKSTTTNRFSMTYQRSLMLMGVHTNGHSLSLSFSLFINKRTSAILSYFLSTYNKYTLNIISSFFCTPISKWQQQLCHLELVIGWLRERKAKEMVNLFSCPSHVYNSNKVAHAIWIMIIAAHKRVNRIVRSEHVCMHACSMSETDLFDTHKPNSLSEKILTSHSQSSPLDAAYINVDYLRRGEKLMIRIDRLFFSRYIYTEKESRLTDQT